MIKLSLLIATMPVRSAHLGNLRAVLDRQLTPEVEIITDISMNCSIGAKRNNMLKMANGLYISFIDDDDLIASDYVQKILTAVENNPDCVGISGVITTNGQYQKDWHISKDYGSWYEKNGAYYRTPNHISPVRRELAVQAGFPDLRFGEDAEYSRRLLPLLKTEVKIPGILYYYRYVSKK